MSNPREQTLLPGAGEQLPADSDTAPGTAGIHGSDDCSSPSSLALSWCPGDLGQLALLCPSAPGGAKAVNAKAFLLHRASGGRGQTLQRPCGPTGCVGGKRRDEGDGGAVQRANSAPSQGSLPPALRELTRGRGMGFAPKSD